MYLIMRSTWPYPPLMNNLWSTTSRRMHLVPFLPGGDGGELVWGVEDPAGGEGVGGAGLGHALPWEDGWGTVRGRAKGLEVSMETTGSTVRTHSGRGHTGADDCNTSPSSTHHYNLLSLAGSASDDLANLCLPKHGLPMLCQSNNKCRIVCSKPGSIPRV